MTGKEDRELFTISIVSKMFDIHPQTLRLYEREGLLAPQRSEGKTRLYSREDLERIRKILSLTRDMGVNLAGVEVVLSIQERMEAMRELMAEMLNYMDQKVKGDFEERWQRESHALVRLPSSKLMRVKVER
ncbi:MAG: MerR family transcriptional regulator [Candidatus Tectomicrobia bacterium]|uniref:MerR family transcriptional regulator n=1 Tax=Tectimicrobiota bacterium TaxID=2528274 RepID=A0A932CLE5_UNCTE|nr:MerR family transcriptional regulator [Candidatus Tectomicrobia bacterium]